jgi:hypothetical protein
MSDAINSSPKSGQAKIMKISREALPISKSVSVGKSLMSTRMKIANEVAKTRRAWRAYNSSRRRNAVYEFLTAVAAVVDCWKKERRLRDSVNLTRNLHQGSVRIWTDDPFLTIIDCAAKQTDAKARSKWATALRFAAANRDENESIENFMRRKGGINECAAQYSKM